MTKSKTRERDPKQPFLIEGAWYQVFAPHGFLFYGQYVCSLGGGMHRFDHVIYMRNAGGQWLSDACNGLSPEAKRSPPWPDYVDTLVVSKSRYWGDTPWVA